MNEKFGIICYVPPRRVYPAVDSFLKNLKDFPPKHPLILFSDEDYGPGIIRLGGSVEMAKTDANKMATNNLIFFVGMRIAASHGLTHVMVLENDCRVICEGWDDIIWKEFLRKNSSADAGGSIVIFNPCSYNRQAAERYHKFLSDTDATRPMPLSMTGSSNLAERRDSCVFPNGAFAIYRMDWILKEFPEITKDTHDYVKLAQHSKTWDYEIAVRLWNNYKENVYDHIVQLDSIYSGYGDIMSTEQDRRDLLTSRKVVGIHQIKSDWLPDKNAVAAPTAMPQKVSGNTSIFIVTYSRDFKYLKHCLRSIQKFATGFSDITILVPDTDADSLREVVKNNYSGSIPVRIKYGREWSGKGFLWHMAQICRADEWALKTTEYIAHLDPDCVFTEPVTPETFFSGGKPVLRYEPFETLCKREPGIWHWKTACENALPFQVNNEGMRGHPELYHRSLYEKTRQLVEEKTRIPFNEYVRSCKNAFPQSYAEFPTLSAVAIHCFGDSYHFHDCSKDKNPDKSPWPVFQAWSHKSPEEPCELMYEGVKRTIVPMDIYKKLGVD